ncbi:MAG TPA: UDP-N-acetylmuramoyl-L-alanyl-D-glutamate--2,6-diaminopimelate ligase [Acidimicrobiales bacterium]|nr:UDP-N-acetylmuramoyl-L-alanyl-D-glutamate--2,6-diaminopimelate ligase [Acidimicrobiales bacterium]
MTQLLRQVDIAEIRGDASRVEISAVDFDSRLVQPGSLFCCVPGATTDGHDYAPAAVTRGASALLCERFVDVDVVQARVAPGRIWSAMAEAAAALHGYPAHDLQMVGVTGTNGKTTVTQLVRSILDVAGRPTGVIGTLSGERTTPESPVLQGLLADLRDRGRHAVAMEVSSHALAQQLVDGILFDVAAFTNLSHDHLDQHATMDDYFAAKASLFEPSRARLGVVNVDDPWGERLWRSARIPVVPVRRSDISDVTATVGRVAFQWRGRVVRLALGGLFNVDNALMAASIASALEVDDESIVAGLAQSAPVPGRMEVIAEGAPFSVVVDFAHTPAGLEVLLSSARQLTTGRVICVFGCGGNRDPSKRPLMGEVADRLADVSVLTSDNPRDEDPQAIIDDVRAGMVGSSELVVEPDRGAAIDAALGRAHPGDLVVIAGKGHETTQTVGDRTLAFDDRHEARRALARLSASGGSR